MSPDLPQPVLDYLSSQMTVTLATSAPDGTPHASTFMYVNDGPTLYFWARPTSTTAAHIQSNSRISFTIDEYVKDWNKAKGIQGDGRCGLVASGEEVAKLVGLFAALLPPTSRSLKSARLAFISSITRARRPACPTRSSASTSAAKPSLQTVAERVLSPRMALQRRIRFRHPRREHR